MSKVSPKSLPQTGGLGNILNINQLPILIFSMLVLSYLLPPLCCRNQDVSCGVQFQCDQHLNSSYPIKFSVRDTMRNGPNAHPSLFILPFSLYANPQNHFHCSYLGLGRRTCCSMCSSGTIDVHTYPTTLSTCIKVKVALMPIKCRLPKPKLKIFIFLLNFTHRRKMLSARHHVCYWILSITAALVYQGLVTGLGFQENSFRIALIPLMGFAIYII